MNTDYTGLTYGRGYVYRLQYHIVWCVKYRRRILEDEIEAFFKADLAATAKDLGVTIDAMECMPDHVHLLISCSPQHFLPDIIKVFKGNSARHLFMRFPAIKEKLWDGHLWNPSYFVATVSENTTQQVTEYINSQKTK